MSRPIALFLSAAVLTSLAPVAAQPSKKVVVALHGRAEVTIESEQPLRSLAFSPDGKMLAVGAEDVHLFDVAKDAVTPSGVIKASVFDGKTSVRAVAFTPNGKYLVFGHGDFSVRVWDVAGKAETGVAKAHQGKVQAIAVSADGKSVATGAGDRSAILWHLSPDGQISESAVIRDGLPQNQTVRGLAFTPKGTLVAVTNGGTFRTFSLGKDGPKAAGGFQPKTNLGVNRVAANPAATLWAVPSGPTVYLVNEKGTPAGTLGGKDGHQGGVEDVDFSPDGKLLASGGQDGSVIVWDVKDKAARYSKTRPGEFTAVAFSPKADPGTGDLTLAAGLKGGIIHLFQLAAR
jgi:WD40 repeat protein